MTASATGVEMPSSTVLSVTWPAAWTVPFPGGTMGPTRSTMSGVAITLATSQITTTRRKWLGSVIASPCPCHGSARSYDLDEAVHVADRLHRSAKTIDEAGRARDVALPAVEALARGAEGERDRVVVLAQRTGCVVTRVLGVVGDAHQRHRHTHLRYLEDVRGGVRRDRLCGLAVQRELVAEDAACLGEERVAQPRLPVELVDGDVDEGVRRQHECRLVLPVLIVRVDGVIGNPARMGIGELGRRHRGQVQVHSAGAGRSSRGRSGLLSHV